VQSTVLSQCADEPRTKSSGAAGRRVRRGVAWLDAPDRRVVDAAIAAGALLLLSLPCLLLGALVRLTSPGPALYASPRVGKDGRVFRMYKFRSMVAGADQRGSLVTGAGDPRVTRFGRWLRRTKLDELPSLWNVVVGDMALVGPRPENPRSVVLYTPHQRRVLSVRPGLTSLASLKYRREEELLGAGDQLEERYLEIMQDKLRLDLDYLDRASPGLDLRIMLRTLGALIGAGAAHA
jgi:lipopolysaccharide/colanic/teichoic acid biosynthesis glycosyltransferase